MGIGAIIRNKIFYSHSLKTGDFKIVEGYVYNFIPENSRGKNLETFTVCGVKYEYSSAIITGAFNKIRANGGPINQGRWVKIYYKDNHIFKIEASEWGN